ncbi:MAG: 3-oxoacyl-[acyl-carrier-protein] synthase III C-terminal domain-containing protein [Polyangiaceae bacterium]
MGNRNRAGLVSLAVSYPKEIRTNAYFREKYPDVVGDAEQRTLAKIWAAPTDNNEAATVFDREMAPYLKDPFRGAVQRHVLAKGETSLSIELTAARQALAAARMHAADVDLLITSSFLPDAIGTGNATFLAAELGLRGAAWNLETACSSSVVGLQTAAALVRSGEYKNILVVVSCTYSREADERDSLSWFLGDGAGAFLVCATPEGEGILGGKTIHTAETCGAFQYDLEANGEKPLIRMHSGNLTGKVLRDTATVYLRTCCEGALKATGLSLRDVDFFVFNTPTAWYAKYCAGELGIDPSRTIDTYPQYGNMGPALMPTNLYRAARTGRIKRGDTVLLYAVGSASSASAAIMKWGDVALGSDPPNALVTAT